MMADADGEPYFAFRSLAEARNDPDGAVILEGDYGGQVLATAPAVGVACFEEVLRICCSISMGSLGRQVRAAGRP